MVQLKRVWNLCHGELDGFGFRMTAAILPSVAEHFDWVKTDAGCRGHRETGDYLWWRRDLKIKQIKGSFLLYYWMQEVLTTVLSSIFQEWFQKKYPGKYWYWKRKQPYWRDAFINGVDLDILEKTPSSQEILFSKGNTWQWINRLRYACLCKSFGRSTTDFQESKGALIGDIVNWN